MERALQGHTLVESASLESVRADDLSICLTRVQRGKFYFETYPSIDLRFPQFAKLPCPRWIDHACFGVIVSSPR